MWPRPFGTWSRRVAGPKPGLRGEWGDSYETTWASAFDSLFAEIEATNVRVLSWGPGRHTKYYEKRALIAEAVGELPATSVITSEAAFERDGRFAEVGDTLRAEELQVIASDIVLALEVDDASVTGLPVEIHYVRNRPGLRDKVRLFSPERPTKKSGLLGEAVRTFPPDQVFLYTKAQLHDCGDLIARAVDWVQAVRRSRYFADVSHGSRRLH